MIHTNKKKQEDYFYNVFLIVNGLFLLLVILHYYLIGYGIFHRLGLAHPKLEQLLVPVAESPVFKSPIVSSLLILLSSFLALSLVGVKKKVGVAIRSAVWNTLIGGILYLLSLFLLSIPTDATTSFALYVGASLFSLFLFNFGLGKILQYFKSDLKGDLFNKDQESFPQEERKVTNDSSINLPTTYMVNKKKRRGWINIVNPYRGLLVTGSPGSGKTYFVIRHIIEQLIEKNFTMLVYDYKYPDLTQLTYNLLRTYYPKLSIKPTFYSINFDEPTRSHRVNPVDPALMHDISDAYQAAKSIYFGMNDKNGDTKEDPFWQDGAINCLTSILWTLKINKGGRYCTFPHALEFLMGDHNKYVPLLMCDSQSAKYASVLYNAMVEGNEKLLNNMMATLKQRLAKLASPPVYWIMSGNDVTLDINNPERPKILCLANNDQKNHVYSAPISLIVDKISRMINRKGQLKCATIFDEFPTIYFGNVSNQLATARSNNIITVLGIQDGSQNEKNLGRVNSDIIFNITPNIISGSLNGKMAKELSERLGRIKMIRDSINMGHDGPTKNQNVQLDHAVPASTINNLSSGEVVGMVSDTPEQRLELKRFHAHIINDHNKLRAFDTSMEELPVINPSANPEKIADNYELIGFETKQFIDDIYAINCTNQTFSYLFRALEKDRI